MVIIDKLSSLGTHPCAIFELLTQAVRPMPAARAAQASPQSRCARSCRGSTASPPNNTLRSAPPSPLPQADRHFCRWSCFPGRDPAACLQPQSVRKWLEFTTARQMAGEIDLTDAIPVLPRALLPFLAASSRTTPPAVRAVAARSPPQHLFSRVTANCTLNDRSFQPRSPKTHLLFVKT